jgi:lipoprotein-anchoring transpeptidase ErfK/SrfK
LPAAVWLVVAALFLTAATILCFTLRRAKPTPAPPTKQVVKKEQPRTVARTNQVVVTPLPTVVPPQLAPIPAPVVTIAPPVKITSTNVPATARTIIATNSPAKVTAPPEGFPRLAQNWFEIQVLLARQDISSGSIDGVAGSQSHSALAAFQRREGLPATGQLDAETKSKLVLTNSPYAAYMITSNDVARLQPVSPTWLGKSQQSALDYETILELVAEKSRAHPNLIKRLNPTVNWTNVMAGTAVWVPDTTVAPRRVKAAFVNIYLSARVLEAFDQNTNLLAHFPCSIAKRVEKRPVGELHVMAIAPNPTYTFDPAVFPESQEAQQMNGQKLILPPGPNNPVGVAWISLDLPGYGMHGTPKPEDVGRTESHGCFRLANWNAEEMLKLVTIGMPVYVLP